MTDPTPSTPPAYDIVRFLGKGASAEVHLVRMTATGEYLVRKRIGEGIRESWPRDRVEREIRLLQGLDHPNVVRLVSAETLGSILDLFYTYIPGRPLSEAYGLSGGLSLRRFLPVLRDTLRGLEYLHSKNIIHRDLKPANIFLSDAGPAVLLDLGLAKSLVEEDDLTKTGSVPCTPSYAPPEIILGDSLTPSADLYALGVLSYITLAGAHPFSDASNVSELLAAHLHMPARDLAALAPHLPPRLVLLVHQLLEKLPGDRPKDAATVLGILDRIFPEESTKPDPTPQRTEVLVAPLPSPEAPELPSTPAGWSTEASVVVSESVSAAAAAPPSSQPVQRTKGPSPSQRTTGASLALRAALICGALLGTLALGINIGRNHPVETTALPAVAKSTPTTSKVDPPAAPKLAEVHALVQAWVPVLTEDPYPSYQEISRAPALKVLRQKLNAASAEDHLSLSTAVQKLMLESESVGFPPVLEPLSVFRAPQRPSTPAPPRMRRILRAAGVEVPVNLQIPAAVELAILNLERATTAIQVVDERLKRDPSSVVGSASHLMVFSTVIRKDISLGFWYVLNTLQSPTSRAGLHRAYEAAIRHSLIGIRILVEVVRAEPDDLTRSALVAWTYLEFLRVRAPLNLTFPYVPLEDVVPRFQDSPESLLTALAANEASRMQKIFGQPFGETSDASLTASRRALASGIPPGPAGKFVYSLFHVELANNLGRRGEFEPLQDCLERLLRDHKKMAPKPFLQALQNTVFGLTTKLESVDLGLRKRAYSLIQSKAEDPPTRKTTEALRVLQESY